jgi:hypothetical protein
LTIVGYFEFGGWAVAAGFVEAAMIRPGDVLQDSPIKVSARALS